MCICVSDVGRGVGISTSVVIGGSSRHMLICITLTVLWGAMRDHSSICMRLCPECVSVLCDESVSPCSLPHSHTYINTNAQTNDMRDKLHMSYP